MAFQKGQSGNPGGRPKAKGLREASQKYTQEALDTLAHWMRQRENPTASVKATELILDRAWGKSPQAMELTGKDGAELGTANVQDLARAIMDVLRMAQVGEPKAEIDQRTLQ